MLLNVKYNEFNLYMAVAPKNKPQEYKYIMIGMKFIL